MNEPVLQVSGVSVVLDGESVLEDISFSVRKGEALAIIGPNGAGKSVLLKALLGLVPSQGSIMWAKGVHIGYVPQRFHPDRTIPLTVKELLLFKSPAFWRPTKDFFAHLDHELSIVGLKKEILGHHVSDLSGGQFQRLMIAWAMTGHPDVLLFDEPTAGIDVGAEETIYSILHRLQKERGTTVLLVSHDLSIVYRYSQHVLCINKKMICHGAPEDVLTPGDLKRIYGETGFYHHHEDPTRTT